MPGEKFQSLADVLGTSPIGTPDEAKLDEFDKLVDIDSVEDFCRGILNSAEYRRSILHRIHLGILPAAIELRFYDYAHGKPAERVEHTGKDGKPIETAVTVVRRVVVRPGDKLDEKRSADVVH